MDYGLATAQHKLVQLLEEYPLDVMFRDWEEKVRGMKVWWRDQPAVIQYVNPESKELWITLEGIERFLAPRSWGQSDYEEYEDGLYADMLSKEIGWYRE